MKRLLVLALIAAITAGCASKKQAPDKAYDMIPVKDGYLVVKKDEPTTASAIDVSAMTVKPTEKNQSKPTTSEPDNTGRGIVIRKGTVNDNIYRIAFEQFGVPPTNVDFVYLPCPLVEKYDYVLPENTFENDYEKLTKYAGFYQFYVQFHQLTNSITLEYQGPNVFDNCR